MAEGYKNQTWNNSGTGYCKMPDGTLIQWGNVTGISFSNQNMVSGEFTFDIPFFSSSEVKIFGTTAESGVADYIFRVGISCSATKVNWTLVSPNTISVNNRQFSWLAIGRWK